MLLLALLPLLIMALTPAPWLLLLVLALLCAWFYSKWYPLFLASRAEQRLTLDDGQLCWFMPAQPAAVLCRGGSVMPRRPGQPAYAEAVLAV